MDRAWPAVGFDLDGTLFDHEGSATVGVEQFTLALGHEPTTELVSIWFDLEARHFEQWRAGNIAFTEQRRRRLRGFLDVLKMPVPDTTDALDAFFALYLESYRRSWRAYDDAVPVLRKLRAQGTRIGVLTNGNHPQQIDKLELTGLAPLIDVVCVSEEIGVAKPDRQAFDVLAERLATPARQMVFIGDHPDQDIAGARAAGMRAGLVERSGARAGLAAALSAARPE